MGIDDAPVPRNYDSVVDVSIEERGSESAKRKARRKQERNHGKLKRQHTFDSAVGAFGDTVADLNLYHEDISSSTSDSTSQTSESTESSTSSTESSSGSTSSSSQVNYGCLAW